MTSERFELTIATVSGKYPGESGSDTLTFNETSAGQKVEDYELDLTEDYPCSLNVQLWNRNGHLIGTTYDATLCEGSLTPGLQIHFSVYPTLTGTKTLYFHGQIEKMSQSDGVLELECESHLGKLSRIIADHYWASSYREDYERELVYATYPTWPARIDAVDTSWILPPFKLAVCRRDDMKLYVNQRSSSVTIDNTTKMFAQPFSGKDGDHINKWHISVLGDVTNTADLRVSIRECDPVSGPGATDICYCDFPNASGLNAGIWFDCSYYPDNDTGDGFTYADRLRPDKLYCLVLKAAGITTVVDMDIGTNTGTTGDVVQAWYNDGVGGGWVQQTYVFGAFALDWSPWQDIDCDRAYKHASYTDEIWVDGSGRNDIPDTNSYYERACVTYFYGTVTKKTVLENLINLIFGSSADNVSSSITDTLPMYRTAGKTPLECLQQVCDLEEGGLSDRQLVVYDYWSATYGECVCVRPRLKVSDTSYATFSDSSATDTHLRITDYDLQKAAPLKINTVVVIGETERGTPVYASVVDWASRALFSPNEHRHTDKNLRSFSECQTEATRILAAINRADWEGTVTISGCYPDLMYFPVTPAATTNCGGRVVTLSIAALGISAIAFRVRSVKVLPGKTVLSITNWDYSKDDEVAARRLKSRLAENFSATSDLVTHYFARARYESAVTDTTLYMELQDSGAIAIAGQTRVRCTKTSVGAYNIYSAIFMPGNGYTTSAAPVGIIKLYDAETGGTQKASVVLKSCEYFWKLKTTRVMAEMHCNSS